MSSEEPKRVAMPMTLTDLIVALREVLGLIDDAAGKASAVSDALRRRKGRRAAKKIDSIAFDEDGSRFHLEAIAEGRGTSANYQAITDKMDTTGSVVESAIDSLKSYHEFVRVNYGMELAGKLRRLLYAGGGKVSIRMDLEHLTYMYDNHYSEDDIKQEAERILQNIKNLNLGLVELHDLFVGIEQK